ncbi:hypothetical protein PENSPDRAFT_262443 [Peniophora sp. CONT]|nr:hypothetical protein PENSPDRAFT_262443 [Peniophora sp. CONT]
MCFPWDRDHRARTQPWRPWIRPPPTGLCTVSHLTVECFQPDLFSQTMAPDATCSSGFYTRCKRPSGSAQSAHTAIIKQRKFRHRFCIPSHLADLGIKDPAVLLAKLNTILGTDYSLRSTPALEGIMLHRISKGHDLGMAYGMLRRQWFIISPELLSDLESLEKIDRERREAAVVDGLIEDVRMPPRRVWDLFSNRVLPFWVVGMSWRRDRYNPEHIASRSNRSSV